jgi:hypothetical protein
MSFNRSVSAVPVEGGFMVGSLITDIVMKRLTSPVQLGESRLLRHTKKPARIYLLGRQRLLSA